MSNNLDYLSFEGGRKKKKKGKKRKAKKSKGKGKQNSPPFEQEINENYQNDFDNLLNDNVHQRKKGKAKRESDPEKAAASAARKAVIKAKKKLGKGRGFGDDERTFKEMPKFTKEQKEEQYQKELKDKLVKQNEIERGQRQHYYYDKLLTYIILNDYSDRIEIDYDSHSVNKDSIKKIINDLDYDELQDYYDNYFEKNISNNSEISFDGFYDSLEELVNDDDKSTISSDDLLQIYIDDNLSDYIGSLKTTKRINKPIFLPSLKKEKKEKETVIEKKDLTKIIEQIKKVKQHHSEPKFNDLIKLINTYLKDKKNITLAMIKNNYLKNKLKEIKEDGEILELVGLKELFEKEKKRANLKAKAETEKNPKNQKVVNESKPENFEYYFINEKGNIDYDEFSDLDDFQKFDFKINLPFIKQYLISKINKFKKNQKTKKINTNEDYEQLKIFLINDFDNKLKESQEKFIKLNNKIQLEQNKKK